MSFLKHLKIKKVSLVRRGANKRRFLLLKSLDGDEGEGDDKNKKTTNNNNNNTEEVEKLSKEIRSRVLELLKDKQDSDAIVSTIGKEFDDAGVEVAKGLLDFLSDVPQKEPSVPPKEPPKIPPKESQITKADFDKLAKENEDYRKKLDKMETDNRIEKTQDWIAENCAFVPDLDAEALTAKIMKVEDVDAEAAKTMKESLSAASRAVEASKAFSELGSEREGLLNKSDAVEKKFDEAKTPEEFAKVMEGLNASEHEEYRKKVLNQ